MRRLYSADGDSDVSKCYEGFDYHIRSDNEIWDFYFFVKRNSALYAVLGNLRFFVVIDKKANRFSTLPAKI